MSLLQFGHEKTILSTVRAVFFTGQSDLSQLSMTAEDEDDDSLKIKAVVTQFQKEAAQVSNEPVACGFSARQRVLEP